ncbi:MAG TPA: 3D-(3,5/4)-trihydroxycyclohexane-1,2-dione acylhydrolase (decyclizing) [Acidimicrobiales bacterium]|nr:3D-(3,5/4)-trihydroxycyclohexane-1,2-dione acylhydrolase (decyclizing) [Acidimicrobiales bacterium]
MGTRPDAEGCLMRTERLSTAHALVRWLVAQRTVVDGAEVPLFPGVFAIFGHGNVTCLGQALEEARGELPTWRGQNEQGMALAAVAYAKATRRRQIMVATSSIGPGATNMVTAAGVALANRLPVLLLSGDTFASRIPDPVLQQVEHFGSPSTSVNDAFRAVVRYWDRVTRPEQLVQTLPQALATMLDPADCGPAFLGLPQDIQAEAYDYPARFFEPVVHEIARLRPDRAQLEAAARALSAAQTPLVVAGGGVRYSGAEAELARFADAHGLPVVETVAGKSSLPAAHPCYVGPIGVTGSDAANRLAADADLVLAVGTRLQDFTTGSWTVFRNEELRMVAINAARFDAVKHRAVPVVGDAREALTELSGLLGGWQAAPTWVERASSEAADYRDLVGKVTVEGDGTGLPTYAQVIGAVNRLAAEDDYVVAAAGGFPGELNVNWLAKGVGTFDCEYGFSCMGYEIAGGWGARMARRDGNVIVFVGDGSYMMMNSDLYSSILSGHRLIVIVCDNGGFAVIDRLQVDQGGASYANLLTDSRIERFVPVDFAAHAAAMGCHAETVPSIGELEAAFERAHRADRTTVIVLRTDPHAWTPGGAFWEVGVPTVSERPGVRAARSRLDEGKSTQRVGW